MARSTFEAYKLRHLATISSGTLAPTVAELSAGVDLTPITPVNGVQFAPTQNNASLAMLGDAFVNEEPGTWGLGLTLEFVRDTVTDLAVSTFLYKTVGFIVAMPFGGTIAAGLKVDVYPTTSHNPVPTPSAENEYQRWSVALAVRATPKFQIAVLA